MGDEKWTKEIEPADAARVQLVGGPDDGVGFLISPAPAIALPDRLEYFGAQNDQAGWDGYEKVPAWEWESTATYRYTGFRSLVLSNNTLHPRGGATAEPRSGESDGST